MYLNQYSTLWMLGGLGSVLLTAAPIYALPVAETMQQTDLPSYSIFVPPNSGADRASLTPDTLVAQSSVHQLTDVSPADRASLTPDTLVAQPSVHQLTDVSPTDWAFQALQRLVVNYGCLPGYPDGTFQGDRPLGRYEFAAALQACLQSLSDQSLARTDFVMIEQLQQDFLTERADLIEQTTALETRIAALEARQFSPTSRLQGIAVFSLEQLAGGDRPDGSGADLTDSLTFSNRILLNVDTSFTGQDLLRVRLDALNPPLLNVPATGTNMTRLSLDRNTNNNIVVGKLFYRFPVASNFSLHIDAIRGAYQANASDTFNPGLASSTLGAVSRFGRFNPIYYQGAPGTGITGVYQINSDIDLSLGYLARDGASNPDIGLFGGGYSILAQVAARPTEALNLGLTYVHSYYPSGQVAVSAATGSRLANAPFGNDVATTADHLGIQTSLDLSDRVVLSGWAGLSFATAQSNGTQAAAGDSATLFNWAVTLGLPNLGGQGNLGGVIIGQPPRVTDSSTSREDEDISLHLEAFYRYRLNQNVFLVPGLFVVLNPEHNQDNDAIWLGSLRTVFRF